MLYSEQAQDLSLLCVKIDAIFNLYAFIKFINNNDLRGISNFV